MPKSGFSPFSTLGARLSFIIPMCIAWSQVAGSHQIIDDGFPADPSSFSPSKYSVLSFAESFSTLSNELLKNTSLLLPVNSLLFNPQQSSPLCYMPPRIATGWFMPSDPLPGPRRSSPISLAILTALPSRTLDSWPWPTVGLPSDGETTPMATRLGPCHCRPMNFYVASCCTFCPPASYAFATLAYSQIVTAHSCWLCVVLFCKPVHPHPSQPALGISVNTAIVAPCG